MRRPHLVLSTGVLALPPSLVRWIIAHEVGHLAHGDAERGYAWQRYLNSTAGLDRLRKAGFRMLLRLLGWIPLVGRFTLGVLLILDQLFTRCLRVGILLGGVWYEAWSRWASRQMEFRADAFAASQEGIAPGIELFEGLPSGSFEPLAVVSLWRTHPTHAERIQALREMP